MGGRKSLVWTPPPPVLSHMTSAKSLSLSLGFLTCRVGIATAPPRRGTVALCSLSSSPPKGTSVFVIITKMIVTENQMQGFCPEVRRGREAE